MCYGFVIFPNCNSIVLSDSCHILHLHSYAGKLFRLFTFFPWRSKQPLMSFCKQPWRAVLLSPIQFYLYCTETSIEFSELGMIAKGLGTPRHKLICSSLPASENLMKGSLWPNGDSPHHLSHFFFCWVM